MRIYLASSWRNQYQPAAVATLRAAGHEVYDFRRPASGGPEASRVPGLENGFHWSEIDPAWQSWAPAAYRRLLTTDPIAAAGYRQDIGAMEWAEAGVLLLPCGRSAHLEAGWFAGRPGKKLYIVLHEDRFEPELMYLMAQRICLDIPELIEALRREEAP